MLHDPAVAVILGVALLGVLLLWLAWDEGLVATTRGLLVAAMSFVTVLGGVAIVLAETPFGIGDGTVPALLGQGACAAERSLERRGLHWRYEGDPAVRRTATEQDVATDPSCDDDRIERQWPHPGTELGPGGIVVLRSFCSRPPGCE